MASYWTSRAFSSAIGRRQVTNACLAEKGKLAEKRRGSLFCFFVFLFARSDSYFAVGYPFRQHDTNDHVCL